MNSWTHVLKHLAMASILLWAAGAHAVTFTTNTTIACNDLTYDGQDVVVDNGAVLTIACTHSFNSLTVTNGTVTHPAQDTLGLHLIIAGDVIVSASGQINTNGRGYIGTQGPGGAPVSSTYASGGTHAGVGGKGNGGSTDPNLTCYGSLVEPDQLGSGGGDYLHAGNPGGSGGGLIHLDVGDELSVSGQITANGVTGTTHTGGGAGGSIWLSANVISGAGAIAANGGAASTSGGGGGGGRIAIYFDTWEHAGVVSAFGGTGDQRGGAGSVYSKDNADPNGDVTYNNNSVVGNISRIPGASLLGDLTVLGNAHLVVGSSVSVNSLTVGANSVLRPEALDALTVTVQADATIDGTFHASGLGYAAQAGPGAAPVSTTYGSGGSHAGVGGDGSGNAANPNLTCYGSILLPVDFGSGGAHHNNEPQNPGGVGGGAIHLIVTDLLTVNGSIAAAGVSGGTWSGGGAGGSLWLEVGTLAGTGLISANGGNGMNGGGGGGGGRIAIYFDTWEHAGVVSALGGTGDQYGGAGSIYLKDSANPNGDLKYDNGAASGNISRIPGASLLDNLSVVGNAHLVIGSSASVHSLAVGAASILRPEVLDAMTITVATDATIEGTLHASGLGYAAQAGPGAAPVSTTYGSGGSHAGVGGDGSGNAANPNLTCYGSITQPIDFGSGGAHHNNEPQNPGGVGGGAIHLIVTDLLTVNGSIAAAGVSGGTWSGGGAGGSLWLEVGTLAGTGLISVNGGNGMNNGGGGGGGRIAIYFDTWEHAGVISAFGGSGEQYGGAGSIYKEATNRAIPEIEYDNNNITGNITRTPGSLLEGDVTVIGAAHLVLSDAASINELGVGANSIIRPEALTALEVTVASDASIAATGLVHADALGYTSTQGPGGAPASSTYAGGAAHGGAGGFGSNPTLAIPSHNCYGSIPVPVDFGSGGGSYPGQPGGTGGGVIHLIVMDTLTLEGTLSAIGVSGGTFSGGGSGGSLWLEVGALLGAGTLSTNGGNGSNSGGGGGGGRIAVYYDNWSHTGAVSARGGVGDQHGGAGTVYRKDNAAPRGTATYDNLTSNGAVSFADAATLLEDVVIKGNAVVLLRGTGTINSLNIESTGRLRPDTLEVPDLSIAADALLNGPVDGNGMGYPHLQGPGAGDVSPSWAAGASHAGIGGRGNTGGIPTTDVIYGSTVHPQTHGSGGGDYGSNWGGFGGGAIRLRVGDTLTVNSVISVNATNPGSASGGGAGGSIWINAGTLTGSGTITANGSNGNGDAGGGSGGRIAIYACNLLMSPDSIRALGGDGWEDGGPGTIFIFDPPNDDANNNGQSDQCEVAAGFSDDCNGNQIIDDAEDFGAPQGLTCYHFPGPGVRLLWMCSPNATSYEVYRSTDPNVVIIPGNLIATTTEAEYVDLIPGDPNPPPQFYTVVAVQE